MEIIIKLRNHNSYNELIKFNFDSKIVVAIGTFYSLQGLISLKEISQEVLDYLNLPKDTLIYPGITKTMIFVSTQDFNRLKTSVRRNSIIENIFKDD